MAEGQDSVKLIDDVCQCSICLERYVEPKVLICQHCFCKECLEDLIGVRVVDGNVLFPSKVAEIVCPNCREIHKLENGQTLTSLPGNLHLKQVLEVLNKSSPLQDATGSDYKFEDCSSCPEESRTEKGTRKCVDCSKFFCEKCVKKEHVGGSSDRSSHFIMKMDKSREGEITSCCMEHGNVLKYFCVGCQKLVCTDCVLISHRTHELQTVDCAAKMLHNNILKNISSVRSNGKNVEAVRAACLDAVHNQKITETMIASEVRLRKLKILAQVSYALDRAEEQIIDDFHNKGSEFVQKVNEKLEKVDSFLEHHKNVMELIDNFSDVSTLEFLCKVNALKRKAYENFLNTPSWWMQFITEGNVLRNGTAQGIPREGQWKMFLLILELMGCIHTSASTSVAQLRGFSPSLLKPLHPGDEYIKQMFHQMTLAGSEAKLVKTPEPELEGIASSSNNNKLGKSKTLPRPSLANGNEIEASAASAIISLEPSQNETGKPSIGQQVEALADYAGEQRGDLTFKKGDLLTIVEIWEDGWWTAENSYRLKGLVPSTLFKTETQSATVELEQKCSARALYSYKADGDNEISFSAGDVIFNVDRYDPSNGWFYGRAPNGKYGWFPSNYVQFIRGDQLLRQRLRRRTIK